VKGDDVQAKDTRPDNAAFEPTDAPSQGVGLSPTVPGSFPQASSPSPSPRPGHPISSAASPPTPRPSSPAASISTTTGILGAHSRTASVSSTSLSSTRFPTRGHIDVAVPDRPLDPPPPATVSIVPSTATPRPADQLSITDSPSVTVRPPLGKVPPAS